MKRMTITTNNNGYTEESELLFGSASEIKAVYNSIWRNFDFVFSDKAKFNPCKMYGLLIHENLEVNVLSADDVLICLDESVAM